MNHEIVTLAQTSPDAAAFEAGVLELLGRDVGFDAACFLVSGEARPPTAGQPSASRPTTAGTSC
jgi:hypothetical protein